MHFEPVTVVLLGFVSYMMVGHAKVERDLLQSPLDAPMWTNRPTFRKKVFFTMFWPLRWRKWRGPHTRSGFSGWEAVGDLYQWSATGAVLAGWYWVGGKLIDHPTLRLIAAYVVTTLTSIIWAPVSGILGVLVMGGIAMVFGRFLGSRE